jgi:hypothetical protein
MLSFFLGLFGWCLAPEFVISKCAAGCGDIMSLYKIEMKHVKIIKRFYGLAPTGDVLSSLKLFPRSSNKIKKQNNSCRPRILPHVKNRVKKPNNSCQTFENCCTNVYSRRTGFHCRVIILDFISTDFSLKKNMYIIKVKWTGLFV